MACENWRSRESLESCSATKKMGLIFLVLSHSVNSLVFPTLRRPYRTRNSALPLA